MRNVVATRRALGLRRGTGRSALRTLALACALVATPASAGDGDVDTTFGTLGTTLIAPANVDLDHDFANRAAVLGDERILVAGAQHGPSQFGFGLLQLDANGQPDPAFGTLFSGRIVHAVEAPTQPRALVRGHDGSILVLFSDRLARFDAAGGFVAQQSALDLAGGAPNLAPDLRTLALRDDGATLVAGMVPAAGTVDFVAIALDAGGTPLAAYGTNGIARVPVGASAVLADATFVAGDALVLAGSIENAPPALRDMLVLRLTRDGALDTAFGTGGRTIVGIDRCGAGAQLTNENADEAAFVREDRGGLVLVGRAGSLPCRSAALDDAVAIVRLTGCGLPDPGYGSAGVTTFNAGDAGGSDPTAVIVQSDGGTIVGGVQRGRAAAHAAHGFVARVTPQGTLDATFGDPAPVAGVHRFAPGMGTESHVGALAFQAGRIIVAGAGLGAATQDFAVRRLDNQAQLFADSFD